MEVVTLDLKVKVVEREVKSGKEKGKKFLTYKVLNKQTGYYEELRFNRKTSQKPETAGIFILTIKRENINRLGTDYRDFPLTWIKDVESINPYESINSESPEDVPLPF